MCIRASTRVDGLHNLHTCHLFEELRSERATHRLKRVCQLHLRSNVTQTYAPLFVSRRAGRGNVVSNHVGSNGVSIVHLEIPSTVAIGQRRHRPPPDIHVSTLPEPDPPFNRPAECGHLRRGLLTLGTARIARPCDARKGGLSPETGSSTSTQADTSSEGSRSPRTHAPWCSRPAARCRDKLD